MDHKAEALTGLNEARTWTAAALDTSGIPAAELAGIHATLGMTHALLAVAGQLERIDDALRNTVGGVPR